MKDLVNLLNQDVGHYDEIVARIGGTLGAPKSKEWYKDYRKRKALSHKQLNLTVNPRILNVLKDHFKDSNRVATTRNLITKIVNMDTVTISDYIAGLDINELTSTEEKLFDPQETRYIGVLVDKFSLYINLEENDALRYVAELNNLSYQKLVRYMTYYFYKQIQ